MLAALTKLNYGDKQDNKTKGVYKPETSSNKNQQEQLQWTVYATCKKMS